MLICNNQNPTLQYTLQYGGGGVNALTQQAVAALLNAQCQGLNYPLTKSEVINLVQNAVNSGDSAYMQFVTNQLQTYNNP